MQIVEPKTVIIYANESGYEPYTDWFNSLKDTKGKSRIEIRLQRLSMGLYGDCEPVGEGVLELRMFFGNGYRIYFAENDEHIIILLLGGDKSSQKRDISTAKKYWKEYKKNDG